MTRKSAKQKIPSQAQKKKLQVQNQMTPYPFVGGMRPIHQEEEKDTTNATVCPTDGRSEFLHDFCLLRVGSFLNVAHQRHR